MISFYGDSVQFLVPGYLEEAMVAFNRNQEQMRKSLQATFGMFPFGQFEEMGKQKMAMFERALKMLAPYGGCEDSFAGRRSAAASLSWCGEDPRLKRLEAQVDALTGSSKRSARTPKNTRTAHGHCGKYPGAGEGLVLLRAARPISALIYLPAARGDPGDGSEIVRRNPPGNCSGRAVCRRA